MGAGKGATRRLSSVVASDGWHEVDLSGLRFKNRNPGSGLRSMAGYYEELLADMRRLIKAGMRVELSDPRYWRHGEAPEGGVISGVVEKVEGDRLLLVKWDDEHAGDELGPGNLIGINDEIKIYSPYPPTYSRPLKLDRVEF